MFAQPLPKGAVFFIQDVDLNEAIEYRFVDCSNNLVDAGNFTFLQISNTSSTNPPAYSIEGTAPNRYWRIAATTADNDTTGPINGIVIESNQVCGVQLSVTHTDGNSGAVHSFGLPAASLLNVVNSVTSVNGSTAQTRISNPQDTVEYTITLTNPESADLTLSAGAIQDALPPGTTFVSSPDFSCTGLSCASLSDVTIAAGGSAELHITVRVGNSLTTPALTSTVAITGLDCSATGNQCKATTRTTASATAPIPTLTDMALLLLAALLGLSAVAVHRRGR